MLPSLDMRRLLALAASIGLLQWTSTARAESTAASTAACLPAYEATQVLRRDGKLLAAREQAIVCSQPTCPSILARDCASWLAAIEESIPSVVFSAKGPNGEDWLDVRVSIDGAPPIPRLDGKAALLDPGPHRVRFEREGQTPIERAEFLREGEKNRKVSVAFGAEAARGTARNRFPTGAVVFGGVSVVAAAAATTFGLIGLHEKGELEGCKPDCDPQRADAMAQKLVVADVAGAAAIVAGVAALYIFLTRTPSVGPAEAKAPLRGLTF